MDIQKKVLRVELSRAPESLRLVLINRNQRCKNIQKDPKSVQNSQNAQFSDSKKRKLFGDSENKYAQSTSKIKSCKDSIPAINSSEVIMGKSEIKAHRRLKTSYKDEKIISKTKPETSHFCNVNDKSVFINPATGKLNNYKRTESKGKISAQSRLISKRKAFEIAAREALSSKVAGNTSHLLMEMEKQDAVMVTYNMERKCTNYNILSPESCEVPARVRQRVKRHLREREAHLRINTSVNHEVYMCSDEEMDWEPSDQKVMIEHINKMRRDHGNVEELSNDFAVFSNTEMGTTNDKSDIVLVFDTNVFISCLPFIKEIRDMRVPILGLPRIYIPWRVLQELDHLKKSEIKPLQVSAIRAIRYLNENFSSRHPRVAGQSYEDHISMKEDSHTCPDDEILHVCLNLKRKDPKKNVVLITNDKNLESKAIVSGFEAFSKDGFVKERLCDWNQKFNGNTDSKMKTITLKNDMAYCRIRSALKKFFQQFLEFELENAFSKDWKKIVTKKPPWMLMDMFECLIKHWRSVFNFVFKREVLLLIEDLKDHFEKVEKGEIMMINEIAEGSKDLLTRMSIFIGSEKPYLKILKETLKEIEMWVETKNPPDIENEEERQAKRPQSFGPSSSLAQQITCNSQFNVVLCIDKVRNLLQIIWNQVKTFCFRISELAATNGMNNPEAVNVLKSQCPHVIRNIQDLVEIVDQLLSLGPGDTSQTNQIILHFTQFLVGLNVFQIDATEVDNLPSYIGLFCEDDDGRMILCKFVNDLKQFTMGIIDGMKVLERL